MMDPHIKTFPDGTAILYAESVAVREDDVEAEELTGHKAPVHWRLSAYRVDGDLVLRYMASVYYEGRVVVETADATFTLCMTFEEFDALYTDYLKSRPRFAFN